jgi:hypothetical protein
MRLDEHALLDAWEHGARRGNLDRALSILASAGHDAVAFEDAPIGRCDSALLDVHAATFGERLEGTTDCPKCGETLEVALAAGRLRVHQPPSSEPLEAQDAATGIRLRCRLPTPADLRVAAAAPDAQCAQELLLERCVVDAERDGRPIAARELPADALELLDRMLSAADPQSDLRVVMTCPDCDHGWTVALDVADFVWQQVDSRARETLLDVAALSAAYGWSEAEVLAMTPARREAYLELAR